MKVTLNSSDKTDQKYNKAKCLVLLVGITAAIMTAIISHII